MRGKVDHGGAEGEGGREGAVDDDDERAAALQAGERRVRGGGGGGDDDRGQGEDWLLFWVVVCLWGQLG